MRFSSLPREGSELPVLISDLFGPTFRHGFATRDGGVSPAPYDSLNLGFRWGDTRENVLENRRRVRAAAGVERLHLATQVHGARVVQVRAGDDPAATAQQEADALITGAPGLALGTMVADCVPVLLADLHTGACAAVHAGWRGTVAGVVPNAVTALTGLGSRLGDLRVALGPAIGPCCFEVGEEVAQTFTDSFPSVAVVRRGAAKAHVDLRRALQQQLQALGVHAGAIDATDACTMCDPVRFFSFRREGTRTGQHMGFIVSPG